MPRKIYVHGPGRWAYMVMFNEHPDYEAVPSLEEADGLCLTGGADVEPRRYGEMAIPETHSDRARDQSDIRMVNAAGPNRMKIGICRGGQLLNVVNGGRMWQHVDNHGKQHFLTDYETNKRVWVTSTHHQMMRPASKDVVTVAVAHESSFRQSHTLRENHVIDPDPEVLWYPKTKSLCFQPHPEFYGATETREYFFELLKRFWKDAA